MKRIILTGGGTAGHVTPNIALIPKLRELGYDIQYIGSYNGIEKELIEPFGIPYHGISSGKLRRYFSLQNFTDPFRVIKGFGEARKLIKIAFLLFADDLFMPLVVFVILNLIEKLFLHLIRHFNVIQRSVLSDFLFNLFSFFFHFIFQ